MSNGSFDVEDEAPTPDMERLARLSYLQDRTSVPRASAYLGLPKNPLSRARLAAYFSINFGFGALLGLAANVIQVITTTNGIYIFIGILIVSIINLCWSVYKYHCACMHILHNAVNTRDELNDRFKMRLRNILTYVQTTFITDIEASAVTNWINTKRIQANNISIHVIDINSKVIVIDKGSLDGIAPGMFFAVYKQGEGIALEICQVSLVENRNSWLSHSGKIHSRRLSNGQIVLRCVDPPNIQSTDIQIGDIVLLAEGFGEDPQIIDAD